MGLFGTIILSAIAYSGALLVLSVILILFAWLWAMAWEEFLEEHVYRLKKLFNEGEKEDE